MSFFIAVGETDDPGFIEHLDVLVRGLLRRYSPEHLWIIQIDNWFDHKWLKYSGYGLAASTIPLPLYDTVKVEFYCDKVTFPPFTPNRVLGQWSYVRAGEAYQEAPLPKLPHGAQRKSSKLNLQRRVQGFDGSACYIWYSANTVANGKGSVMVYNVQANQIECWFAAFNRQPEWALQKTKGASRSDIQELLIRK